MGCTDAITTLEWIAFATGVIAVFLSTRQNIWNWPVAIVNVSLYFLLFYRAGLYSDMGLQLVYLLLSVYGWYEWLYGGANRTELRVSHASARTWLISAGVAVLFWLTLSTVTSRLQGVSLPHLDAALTTVSLVAQWMMTRKLVENWLLWIAVDLVYVPMFVYKGLCLTAGLYGVFLVLAVLGYVQWRRAAH
jgi:nicotinamide mononucleotide transporter